jgi:hypothetical protein
MVKNFYFLILILLYILFGYAITINSIAFSYTLNSFYDVFVDKFNNYSKENNLNV